jgi:hypothetical protein
MVKKFVQRAVSLYCTMNAFQTVVESVFDPRCPESRRLRQKRLTFGLEQLLKWIKRVVAFL